MSCLLAFRFNPKIQQLSSCVRGQIKQDCVFSWKRPCWTDTAIIRNITLAQGMPLAYTRRVFQHSGNKTNGKSRNNYRPRDVGSVYILKRNT